MQRLSTNIYERIGHTTYVRLVEHLGYPVPERVREANRIHHAARRARRGR